MAENEGTPYDIIPIPDLAERWGVSLSRVRRLIEDHHLAAVRRDGILGVPAEFVRGDEPITGLRGTLLQLLDAGFSEEEAVVWMYATNDELGQRPVDALREGKKSAVRRATQGLAF